MSTVNKTVSPANMRELAEKMIDFLSKNEFWFQMIIYVDNEAWYSEPKNNTEKHFTKKGNDYYVKTDMDVKDYLEYNNPDTISLVFEGPLYHKINYEDYDYVSKLSEKFLKPYGLYFEQGYAWSITAYK